MQEHAFQASSGQLPVQLEVSVLVVTCDRKTQMRKVDANLMGAAGFEFRAQEAEIGPRFFEPEYRF